MGKYVKREDVLKKLKDVSKLADGKSGRAVIALLRASLDLCSEHIGDVTDMAVCSACHNNLLTAFPAPPGRGQRKTG